MLVPSATVHQGPAFQHDGASPQVEKAGTCPQNLLKPYGNARQESFLHRVPPHLARNSPGTDMAI